MSRKGNRKFCSLQATCPEWLVRYVLFLQYFRRSGILPYLKPMKGRCQKKTGKMASTLDFPFDGDNSLKCALIKSIVVEAKNLP